jgi:type II secretory pathway component PulC
VENKLFVAGDGKKIVAQAPEKKEAIATVTHTADDDIRIILDRNLFGPPPASSSNQQPESVAIEDLQATSLDLVLMGTVIGGNDENRAIILEKAKKKQDIYQQGEMVQGAVLKEILRGKVILNYNEKDQILDMAEASRYSSKAPIAAANEVRQEQAFPGPEPEILPPEQQENDVQANEQVPAGSEVVEPDVNEQVQDNLATEPAPVAEQDTAEMASPPAEASPTEVQPKTIRPARRFTIELPPQSSQ